MTTAATDIGVTRRVQAAGSQEMRDLMSDVEHLIGQVGNLADPEIARVRLRVEKAMASARLAIGEGADQIGRQAEEAVVAGNRYVHERPWPAIGVAAVAGLAVGFLLARR